MWLPRKQKSRSVCTLRLWINLPPGLDLEAHCAAIGGGAEDATS
ncbi:MAG: hypothetical protein ACI802_003748, partial [Candidatus Paceibacteria bacterium]